MIRNIKAMVNGNKFELKKLTVDESRSDETTCFEAEAWLNGEYLGTTWNDGNGGPTFYPVHEHMEGEIELLESELSKYHKTVKYGEKEYTLTYDIELLIDCMVAEAYYRNQRVFFVKTAE